MPSCVDTMATFGRKLGACMSHLELEVAVIVSVLTVVGAYAV